MVARLALLWLLLASCADDAPEFIVGHRAQGVGDTEENRAANVPRLFAEGFGAEIDIRGDGARDFELGHFSPNGDTLGDVFDVLEDTWQPEFAGTVLLLDIANDHADTVSNTLIDFLYDRVPGTPLEALQLIVQSSNIESLARLHGASLHRTGELDLLFALTYWLSTEYTTASWIDLVTGNVSSFGELRHPKPVVLFGVETRSSYRRAIESRAEVIGVITNHPRRIAELCDCL